MSDEVIVVDFRQNESIRAKIVGARLPQLVAKEFNATRSSDIAMVINDDGKINELTSNYDAARMLARITRHPVVYVDVPENIARQSMRELGVPASLIEGLLERKVTGARSSSHVDDANGQVVDVVHVASAPAVDGVDHRSRRAAALHDVAQPLLAKRFGAGVARFDDAVGPGHDTIVRDE
jgi:hypothetical protein